jgi:hypothetical protein
MLVYANSLQFMGPHAPNAAFRAVGAWLKEHLGYGLTPATLKERGEHKGSRDGTNTWVQIEASSEKLPELYTWTLKHADAEVRGRQWIIEIGLQLDVSAARFTCVVGTDDASVLVTAPTFVYRPRVIGYLIRNISDYNDTDFFSTVPSLSAKSIGDDVYSYKAFKSDVEHDWRNYPLVVVSPDLDGRYLIDVSWSPRQLIGLAQLIVVCPSYDRYEMAQTLGTKYGAWSGAINIIDVRRSTGVIKSRLFRKDEVLSWGDSSRARALQLSALVTAQMNIPMLRERIRPEGVRARAVRSRLERLHSGTIEEKEKIHVELGDAWTMAIEMQEANDLLKAENSQLQASLRDMEAEQQMAEHALASLRYELSIAESAASGPTSKIKNATTDGLLELVCQTEAPTPAQCLEILSSFFGKESVVLPTAMKSAEDYRRFRQGRRLLSMLICLVKDYRDAMISGGDSVARKVFPNNVFAAQESETTVNSPALRKKRIFIYKGVDTEMFRHLKIGVSDNERDMIRVHFAWDAPAKLIVIGHCGRHLPIASR